MDRSALPGSPIMPDDVPAGDTDRLGALPATLATGSYGCIALSVRALLIIVPVCYHALEAVRLHVRQSRIVKVDDETDAPGACMRLNR